MGRQDGGSKCRQPGKGEVRFINQHRGENTGYQSVRQTTVKGLAQTKSKNRERVRDPAANNTAKAEPRSKTW